MRTTKWIGLLAVLLISIAGCAPTSAPAADTGEAADPGTPKSGGALTIALDGEIDTIDPHVSVTIVGFQVYPMIFEGLVKLNDTLDDVEPLLAESWEQTDDLTYVFKLREGVTFHDGTPFTAEDVVYSYERVMNEDIASARRPDFLPVESVEALDDYTVQFTMAEPFAPFLSKLELLRIVPANPDNDPATDPIGTGPFVMNEWISGQSITLDRNPDYWQEGLPYLDQLVYRPIPEPSTRAVEIQTGGVDMLNAVPAKDVKTLDEDANVNVNRVTGVVRDHIGYNMASDTFKDNPNLRKAISWAIDRDTIADSIMFGLAKPAQVAIPDSHWAYNPAVADAYGYDLEKAKEYYEQADPKPESLTVKVSPTYPNQVKMAELMQQDLAEVGIDLEIEQLEWSTWIQEVVSDGDYEIEIVLISGGSDPDDFFYQWHHTGEVFNLWRYSDPDMDEMLESARTAVDQQERQDLYYQIQEKLIEDAPLAHIIYRDAVSASGVDVKDYVMTGRTDMDFREVWLDR